MPNNTNKHNRRRCREIQPFRGFHAGRARVILSRRPVTNARRRRRKPRDRDPAWRTDLTVRVRANNENNENINIIR